MMTQPSARDQAILRSFAHRIDASDPGALNNLGVLYFTKGMIAESVGAFTRALDLDARMTIAQRNIEIAYFTSGYYDDRLATLEAQLTRDARDREARWSLGCMHLLLGDIPRALAAFSVLLRDAPDDVPLVRQVAAAEARAGNLVSASQWLQHALDLEPDDADVHFQLGEVAYHRGMNDEARRALERAIELAPDHAEATYLLGFVLGDLGEHESAQAIAARALRLNPALGRARANLSLERFDRGSHEQARVAREARGILAHEDQDASQMTHYNLGLAFRHKHYLDDALREFAQALDRGEDAFLVRQAMAEVQLLRGDTSAALPLYEALVAERPNDARLWNARGVALHHGGRYVEARESYRRALSADPAHAAALNNLGVAACHAGDVAQARDAFARALALDAGGLKARLNLAYLLVRHGEVEGALATYRQVLRLSPEHPVAWNGVGLVLAGQSRFDDARTAYSRAIEARPSYAEAHYNLGFALTNLGDHEGALRETQRALELDAYYAPQKFELDIEQASTRLEVPPEFSGSRRDATVRSFAFEESALETLFDDLAPEGRVEALGESPYARVWTLLAEGDHDRAAAEVRRVMGAGGPRVDGLVASGSVFLARGASGEALERFREARRHDSAHGPAAEGEVRALVALGRYAEAAAPAEWLASHRAESAEVQLLAACVRAETGRPDDARTGLSAAHRLAAAEPRVLREVARLHVRLGDVPDAVTAMRAAWALAPDDAEIAGELGHLLADAGDVAGAEGVFATLAGAASGDAVVVLALARLRRDLGRAGESVEPLAALLIDDPYHFDALAMLGESLFLAGRRADARFAFARILRFVPEHVAALYFEGVLLAEEHEYALALARWERVAGLAPDSEYAQRAARDARTAMAMRERLLGAAHGEAA
ncbi:MAG: tetratricopeptide repeat protein [Gemmatimonadaceae bacterium]|nr:tetratricopeptide repeat protein [Gemmatimonadaceae bacterium]